MRITFFLRWSHLKLDWYPKKTCCNSSHSKIYWLLEIQQADEPDRDKGNEVIMSFEKWILPDYSDNMTCSGHEEVIVSLYVYKE